MEACVFAGFDPCQVEGQPATDLFEEYRGRGPQRGCLRSDIAILDKLGSNRGMGGSGAKAFADLHLLLECGAARRLSRPNA